MLLSQTQTVWCGFQVCLSCLSPAIRPNLLMYPTPAHCPTLSPGGQQWGGVFYAEIESSCAKVQGRKGGLLQLALPKKVPQLTWPSLLVSSRAGWGRDTQCR